MKSSASGKGERVRVRYDQDVDILSIVLLDRPVARSKEVRPGVLADLDKQGRVLGFGIQGIQQFYPELDLDEYPPLSGSWRWLPLKDAAARLGIRPDTLRQQVLAGKAKAEKLGRQWLIREDRLQEYAATRRKRRKAATA